jgi:hypothetical protein
VHFKIIYSQGHQLVGPSCIDEANGGVERTVNIAPIPTCSIAPPSTNVCAGSSATFTVTGSGPASGQPYDFIWSGPNGFTQVNSNVLTASITINNAQAADAGTYTARIFDSFGCSNTCTATLTVTPNPTCTISNPGPFCGGSTNVHTSTVLPAGGTVTHSWSISGDGTIQGSTTGASVTVVAGASGSYTVTDNVTRDGCPGTCSLTVNVNPNPTCSISNPGPFCGGSTNVHTSTVLPAGGTVTHSWSISGDGTIQGSTTGASVTVVAGASGSYTVTDNITRDGCPGVCSLTVNVTPNPTCTISNPGPFCGGSTNVHTSTVLPAGGTVTHSWSISGDGTIQGSTTAASVTVVAGASGSYTVTDNITRDGCPGVCSLTVNVTPNPTCTIAGLNPAACGSTNTYTSTVLPAGGTVTHSWSITGTGTIQGSATASSVTVVSGGNGSFALTDNITRDGCPGQCSLTVTNICAPKICLTKDVACAPASGICDGTLTYGDTATGVANSANPAFCYKLVVSNCGDDALTNVTVNDPQLGGVIIGPISLAVGDSVTGYFKQSWGVGSHTNTAIASGVGAGSGITVTDTNSAVAIVLDINITCDVTLESAIDLETNSASHVTLPNGSANVPVTMVLTLCNTGTSPLNVTNVTGLPATDCDTNAITLPYPINIPAGECRSFTNCVLVSCPGVTFTVSARAVADDRQGTLCVHDAQGNLIVDDSSPCTADVTCEEAVTCRVTGGGTLLPDTTDLSCIPVTTTIFPLATSGGIPIKKITHGGQLGAPFSQMDCGAVLGNPCIRGQWQHTRHYVGPGNPRDVIDMDFHSVTPKGQFDSLSCACLGCCVDGEFITPITLNGICNPDDHKVCGPQPRPAPANAIIFSGVGKLTPTTDQGANGKNAQWVIFRVYIEDRSEPGGFHPNGAVEPSDIYCFQAWKTGIPVSKKPDFSTVSAPFRMALGQANCDFLEALQSGALAIGSLPSPTVNGVTADVQDCGPLHDGNHQIHPATGATCTP